MRKVSSVNTSQRGRRIPPVSLPPKQDSNGHDIKRIDEIIRNARTTWFLLLGVLVFAGITLLGVKDIDFFSAQSETKLPLVGVSVPVEYFFWAGAALVTALYVYFHLYLELLWAALGRAPARIDGEPLSERISPWLVVEWALRYRDWLNAHRQRRQERLGSQKAPKWWQKLVIVPRAVVDWFYPGEPIERSAAQRVLGWVGTLMSVSLVWMFGLFVLFYFWWRSMPAHLDWMSLWLGLLFTFALWMAWRSWRAAKRMLDGRGSTWTRSNFTTKLKMGVRTFSVFAALMLIISSVTLVRTASDWWPGEHAEWKDYGGGIAAADWIKLYKQDVEDHSAYWEKRKSEAKSTTDKWRYFADRTYTDFFSRYIARADLAEAQLVELPKDWLSRDEAEKEFRAQWAKREGLPYRDPFPDIPQRDIEADFQDALLDERKKLERGGTHEEAPAFDAARFRLQWAISEGLAARSPFPVHATRQPETEFQQAWEARRKTWLDTQAKPNLEGRNLRRADLSGAFFPGVKMKGVQLGGADLRLARLEGADTSEAKFEGADLSAASLKSADLRLTKLEGADLPSARLQGADLRFASLKGADLRLARLETADLRGAKLEGVDLWGAELKDVDLRFARLEGADLSAASLEGAVLWGTRLFGKNDTPLRFSSITSLEAAEFSGSALRVADLSGIDVTELKDFNESFGDGSVAIAEKDRPSRWCKAILTDAEFFGRWRGYIDPGGSKRASNHFDNHPPIQPSPC